MNRLSGEKPSPYALSRSRCGRESLAYRLRLDRALIIVLLAHIGLFVFYPRKIVRRLQPPQSIHLGIVVEEMPATVQTVRRGKPRPEKPQIPLPVEDSVVPEDATIDETLIRWDAGDSPFGRSGRTAAVADTLLPRPILQVMPEYPHEAKKSGRSGVVRLLVLVDQQGNVGQVILAANTTGLEVCAREAISAAHRNRYQPGLIDNRPSEIWVTCEYGFEPE